MSFLLRLNSDGAVAPLTAEAIRKAEQPALELPGDDAKLEAELADEGPISAEAVQALRSAWPRHQRQRLLLLARVMRLEQSQSITAARAKVEATTQDVLVTKHKTPTNSGDAGHSGKAAVDKLQGKLVASKAMHECIPPLSHVSSLSHCQHNAEQVNVCGKARIGDSAHHSMQSHNDPPTVHVSTLQANLSAAHVREHKLRAALNEAVASADKEGHEAEVLRAELEEQHKQHGRAMQNFRDTCDEKLRQAVQAAQSWVGPHQEGAKRQIVQARQNFSRALEECAAEKQRNDALQHEVAVYESQVAALRSEVQHARVRITLCGMPALHFACVLHAHNGIPRCVRCAGVSSRLRTVARLRPTCPAQRHTLRLCISCTWFHANFIA
jgi:ElaB/YqjD/DUF883 family membrane-anchored ribosome-binding protein